jgi:deoxycytidine triphosphate deaminase
MNAHDSPIEARKMILEELEAKDILQKDLSRLAQIPPATLSMVLSGQRKPSMPFLEKCAECLKLDLEELIKSQRDFETWSKTEEGKRKLARESQLDSPQRRALGTLANWQIKLHMDLGDLEITPCDKLVFQYASLDFTRGKFKRVKEHRADAKTEDKSMILKPLESALVYSREAIRLPPFLVGRVGGISFHILHGVSVSFGLQLDPLWKGTPFALFSNHSIEPFTMDPGEQCFSVEFSYLSGEVEEELDRRI